MSTDRLLRAVYLFPAADEVGRIFFTHLTALLGEIPTSLTTPDRVLLVPTHPPDALPTTEFRLADVPFPQLLLTTAQPIHLELGRFILTSTAQTTPAADPPPQPARTMQEDALGPYVQTSEGEETTYTLPLDELHRRLAGHIVRCDHTGLNLPTALVDRAAWNGLLTDIAAVANLYRYPTGEDWPFILPATEDEFTGDIHAFALGREPKLELVYDGHARHPLIQIDLDTDLTRPELEALLPGSYATAIPGLDEFFRTVYVTSPWPDLSIRVDLRYKGDSVDSDWATGAWLVTAGGRIGR
jgi:hypothetical protein